MQNHANYHLLFGVKIHTCTIQELLENVYNDLSTTSSPRPKCSVLSLYTVNPEFIVSARENKWFKTILNQAAIAVPDGIGIIIAGLLKKKGFPARITGVQLVTELTKLGFEHNFCIGFLGGKDDSAQKTADYFRKQYLHLDTWYAPGPRISYDATNESISVSKRIKMNLSDHEKQQLLYQIASTDILFVAFGAPKQELFIEWLKTQKGNLTTSDQSPKTIICVGVGGSLDEISGNVPHTPRWVEAVGMKWLFRLATEPWRWKRQRSLLTFIRMLFSGE